MATGWGTKLIGATGEYLVASELCRRGHVAAPFAGNVPHYDLIASDERGVHHAVQVKTITGKHWQFDIRSFANVTLNGRRQTVRQARGEPFPKLKCVMVALGESGKDRFFIMPWRALRDIAVQRYRKYLKKHGGIRPRAHDSFHTAVDLNDVLRFEQRWEYIVGAASRRLWKLS